MQKSQVKSFLGSLQAGQIVNLQFRGASRRVADNGPATFVGTVRGRGKGGSLISTFTQLDGRQVVAGTKDSDQLLSLTAVIDGSVTIVGAQEDQLAPVVYGQDRHAGKAAELKEIFKQLLDTGFHGRFHQVKVESSQPELDGVFTVSKATQLRGRVGQVVLKLAREGQEPVMLCSYTHSAVVSNVSIVA